MTEHKETKYKVFIEDKPVLIMDIPVDKKQLLRDHLKIFNGFSQNTNLSAKDIHELYWDTTEHKYTKSMKTIYRYLDLLEGAKLIKISGHRKPIDSHMTEKLYCRSAMLYYSKEPVKWWELPEYKKQFEKKEEFFIKLENIKQENRNGLRELINSYTEARDRYINIQLKLLERKPELVAVLSDLSIMEIKSIITDIANFEIFMNEPDLIERFKKLQ